MTERRIALPFVAAFASVVSLADFNCSALAADANSVDDAWREGMLREDEEQESNPQIPQLDLIPTVKRLSFEAQQHLRGQLTKLIFEIGGWDPAKDGKEYPYQPSANALGDVRREAQEREAWKDLVQALHARERAALQQRDQENTAPDDISPEGRGIPSLSVGQHAAGTPAAGPVGSAVRSSSAARYFPPEAATESGSVGASARQEKPPPGVETGGVNAGLTSSPNAHTPPIRQATAQDKPPVPTAVDPSVGAFGPGNVPVQVVPAESRSESSNRGHPVSTARAALPTGMQVQPASANSVGLSPAVGVVSPPPQLPTLQPAVATDAAPTSQAGVAAGSAMTPGARARIRPSEGEAARTKRNEPGNPSSGEPSDATGLAAILAAARSRSERAPLSLRTQTGTGTGTGTGTKSSSSRVGPSTTEPVSVRGKTAGRADTEAKIPAHANQGSSQVAASRGIHEVSAQSTGAAGQLAGNALPAGGQPSLPEAQPINPTPSKQTEPRVTPEGTRTAAPTDGTTGQPVTVQPSQQHELSPLDSVRRIAERISPAKAEPSGTATPSLPPSVAAPSTPVSPSSTTSPATPTTARGVSTPVDSGHAARVGGPQTPRGPSRQVEIPQLASSGRNAAPLQSFQAAQALGPAAVPASSPTSAQAQADPAQTATGPAAQWPADTPTTVSIPGGRHGTVQPATTPASSNGASSPTTPAKSASGGAALTAGANSVQRRGTPGSAGPATDKQAVAQRAEASPNPLRGQQDASARSGAPSAEARNNAVATPAPAQPGSSATAPPNTSSVAPSQAIANRNLGTTTQANPNQRSQTSSLSPAAGNNSAVPSSRAGPAAQTSRAAPVVPPRAAPTVSGGRPSDSAASSVPGTSGSGPAGASLQNPAGNRSGANEPAQAPRPPADAQAAWANLPGNANPAAVSQSGPGQANAANVAGDPGSVGSARGIVVTGTPDLANAGQDAQPQTGVQDGTGRAPSAPQQPGGDTGQGAAQGIAERGGSAPASPGQDAQPQTGAQGGTGASPSRRTAAGAQTVPGHAEPPGAPQQPGGDTGQGAAQGIAGRGGSAPANPGQDAQPQTGAQGGTGASPSRRTAAGAQTLPGHAGPPGAPQQPGGDTGQGAAQGIAERGGSAPASPGQDAQPQTGAQGGTGPSPSRRTAAGAQTVPGHAEPPGAPQQPGGDTGQGAAQGIAGRGGSAPANPGQDAQPQTGAQGGTGASPSRRTAAGAQTLPGHAGPPGAPQQPGGDTGQGAAQGIAERGGSAPASPGQDAQPQTGAQGGTGPSPSRRTAAGAQTPPGQAPPPNGIAQAPGSGDGAAFELSHVDNATAPREGVPPQSMTAEQSPPLPGEPAPPTSGGTVNAQSPTPAEAHPAAGLPTASTADAQSTATEARAALDELRRTAERMTNAGFNQSDFQGQRPPDLGSGATSAHVRDGRSVGTEPPTHDPDDGHAELQSTDQSTRPSLPAHDDAHGDGTPLDFADSGETVGSAEDQHAVINPGLHNSSADDSGTIDSLDNALPGADDLDDGEQGDGAFLESVAQENGSADVEESDGSEPQEAQVDRARDFDLAAEEPYEGSGDPTQAADSDEGAQLEGDPEGVTASVDTENPALDEDNGELSSVAELADLSGPEAPATASEENTPETIATPSDDETSRRLNDVDLEALIAKADEYGLETLTNAEKAELFANLEELNQLKGEDPSILSETRKLLRMRNAAGEIAKDDEIEEQMRDLAAYGKIAGTVAVVLGGSKLASSKFVNKEARVWNGAVSLGSAARVVLGADKIDLDTIDDAWDAFTSQTRMPKEGLAMRQMSAELSDRVDEHIRFKRGLADDLETRADALQQTIQRRLLFENSSAAAKLHGELTTDQSFQRRKLTEPPRPEKVVYRGVGFKDIDPNEGAIPLALDGINALVPSGWKAKVANKGIRLKAPLMTQENTTSWVKDVATYATGVWGKIKGER